jgi:phospholipid/cholesterol/gamma-HCH transport system substrate-binding protein
VETSAPSLGKILSMVLFALSCVGLLLFLWVEFGGTVPFNAQGYRFQAAFPYAQELSTPADVRIAGVTVGKVVTTTLDASGNRTVATLQMNKQYAPVRRDTKAILRIKTILGETYVELTPGSPHSPPLPDGGRLPNTQVVPAVQIDDIFNALDGPTRHAFQTWQQSLAQAVNGNDQNLNYTLGNLPTFAADATDILQVLDVEHAAVVRLTTNGSTTFNALTRNQSALRNLITTGETVFHTTASVQNSIKQTFAVFPTFLDETKATMARLQSFAIDTDPLIRALNPALRQAVPTLAAVKRLSPDLKNLFYTLGLRPASKGNNLVDVSKTGLPAITTVLKGLQPVLDQLGPWLEQFNPIVNWLGLHQQLLTDFISLPATTLNATTAGNAGGIGHYLRTVSPIGISALAIGGPRTPANRGNTYPQPLWAPSGNPKDFIMGGGASWDCNNTGGDPNAGGNSPCWVDTPPGQLLGQPQPFPHVTATTYSNK